MTRELPEARLIESVLADWHENVVRTHTYSMQVRAASYQQFLTQQARMHQLWVETAKSGLCTGTARAGAYSMDVNHILMRSLMEYWRRECGIGYGLIYDIYFSLCVQFLQQLEFVDEDTLYALTGHKGGLIFVANHQTAVESSLFSIVFGALLRRPVVALSKAEHQNSWIGRFLQLVAEYPGAKVPSPILYMDRADAETVLRSFHTLARMVSLEERTGLIHVEGTRARQAGQPVVNISSTLIDIACEADFSLVPVRFTGGLPAQVVDARLDYPIGFGSQDIRVGRPIDPGQLRAMTSAKRKGHVLERLNRLIPHPDIPHQPKPMFEQEVHRWQTSTPMTEDKLGLVVALQQLPHPSEETLSVLRVLEFGGRIAGDSPEQDWLRKTVDFFLTSRRSALQTSSSDFLRSQEERER